MNNQSYPFVAKIYVLSRRVVRQLFILIDACLVGFWLGVLKRETLHIIDQYYYDGQKMYRNEAYNRQGLWPWEQAVVDKYFQKCRCLLVTSVGGGREVLALRQLGYEVDGFECHPWLVDYANRLLQQAGDVPNIQLALRDQCPISAKQYDGLIIGWGAYMLIQDRQRRIAFLQQLRSQTQEQSPLLLSFFYRSGTERRFRAITAIGNAIRTILGRNSLRLGDDLAPNYVHYFTSEEIAAELQQGGFELVFYSTESYGHAVGIAATAVSAME